MDKIDQVILAASELMCYFVAMCSLYHVTWGQLRQHSASIYQSLVESKVAGNIIGVVKLWEEMSYK